MRQKNKDYIISPSILSADFLNLNSLLTTTWNAGIRWLHYDVMDFHQVPNLTYGPKVLADLSRKFPFFYDCHMMVEISHGLTYLSVLEAFVAAGGKSFTFHISSFKETSLIAEFIQACRILKVQAALAIEDLKELPILKKWLSQLDMVLVMSVKPGFGGQKFQPGALEIVKAVRTEIIKQNLKTLIEIDGGVNASTASSCRAAGVDILVAGSYFFNHHDVKTAISVLNGKS